MVNYIKSLILAMIIFIRLGAYSQKPVNTKVAGEKIMKGEIIYNGDNEEILFQVLDSLFCRNKTDKTFYFKVANKIQQQSDGALSEYFSGIASNYYMNYNSEFVKNSLSLSVKDVNAWLQYAAFDLAATQQDLTYLPILKKDLELLVTNCHCDSASKVRLKKYNEILYKETKIELSQ